MTMTSTDKILLSVSLLFLVCLISLPGLATGARNSLRHYLKRRRTRIFRRRYSTLYARMNARVPR